MAVKAHRYDRLGSRRDGRLDQRRVQIVAVFLDIHIHRLRTQKGGGLGRCDIGKTRRDDLVARTNAERHQGNLKRISPVGYADTMACAGKRDKLFLKLRDFGPEDELAVIEHALDGGIHVRLQSLVLALEVDKFHCEPSWT